MEDFVVKSPFDYEPSKPIVLEVKSSRKQHISRDQLRQLDDWVFELSGEQEARKYGLQGKGGIDTLAFVSHGMVTRESRPRYHPTPHKGVFIFNGPVGTPFNKRNKNSSPKVILPFLISLNVFFRRSRPNLFHGILEVNDFKLSCF